MSAKVRPGWCLRMAHAHKPAPDGTCMRCGYKPPASSRTQVIEKLKQAIKLNASDALDFSPADELIREALALLQQEGTT